MKLRNKKTGEIGYFCFANWNDPVLIITDKDGVQLAKYTSLAEVNSEWEDAPEEPKEYWFINSLGEAIRPSDTTDWVAEDDAYHKAIGNYFETKEEAELAVRKLKAWKQLKDTCNFRFTHWVLDREKAGGKICFRADDKMVTFDEAKEFYKDFYLLFGGE